MKKALSIFLSIVMLLTMSAGLNITARAEQSVKSSFDEATGTLTFTGKGAVSASSYDYGNIGDKIKKVIVNVGIDEIQSYAFSKADKLQSVIIYDQTCQISAQGILPIGKDDVTFYGFDKSKTQEWALNHKYPFKYIYTITFLKRDNSVSKIIYALDGETAQEISAKAPNFSFAAYPYTGDDMNNAHYAPVWSPSISAATSDKQYKEHPKLRMCTEIQKITKEPTCAETGVLSTVCSICGRTLETKELAKTNNHVFDNNEEFCLVCHKVKNPNYTTTTTTTTTTTSAPTTQPTTKPTATKASKPTKNAKKVSGNWVDSKYKKASISKLSKGKKAITVKWKKVKTIKGYQIQLATDKKFKKNKKTVTISKQKTTKTTVKKLKAKKKYYVRIRTYKNVKYQGKTIKVYSSWSKVKTVKTK